MPRQFSASEISTILAALRYWQAHRHMVIDVDILAIENNDGETETLTDEEIDTLCEDINLPHEDITIPRGWELVTNQKGEK